MALVVVGFILAVTENHALAAMAAAITSRR